MATSFHLVNNNAASVLAGAIDDNDLSAAVSTGDGAEFDTGKQYLTVGRTDSYAGEILDVTSRSSDTLTIASRGADGTTAVSHEAGDAVECLLVAAHITEIQDAINAIENGTVTLAQVKLGDDTGKLIFGNDSDIQYVYDEATDDRLEITDGTNVLGYWKDLGTTGLFGVTGRIECPQIGIAADTDLLQLAANSFTVNGAALVQGNLSSQVATQWLLQHSPISGAASIRFAPVPASSSDSATVDFFRTANTTAYSSFVLHLGDGTSKKSFEHRIGASTPNSMWYGSDGATIKARLYNLTGNFETEGLVKPKQGAASDNVICGGVAYKSKTAVGNVGTGEDDLMSYSVPASTLGTDGDELAFVMVFKTAANANNKTIKVKFGATTLWDSGAVAANDQRVKVQGRITRTGAATQIAEVSVATSGGFTATVITSAPAETLSGAVTLKATGEATDNNDVQQLSISVAWEPANT